ncbi:response regulator [Geobacter pelophilus]|uniref:histidine kinase n=1 Tax=Geoanaerobacter pelophilus TaxID=60036 RepID=A0AAW4L1P4_9BACT|nr:ATP-binding protein [Geoanaerobacter pelophilus]MBT0664634.1 response regulator [Geoanaerobacter pelophilus]
MSFDRQSLGYRLTVPSFIIIAVVFTALTFIIYKISHTIQEDYSRFSLSAVNSEVRKTLSATASELTAANISGNPVVTEAMQKSVKEALSLIWSRLGHDGVIATADGSLFFSTLPKDRAQAIIATGKTGYYIANGSANSYQCYAERFPLWGWRVVSVGRDTKSLMDRSSAALLLPLVSLGILLMISGIFLVLRKTLRRPVEIMVSTVKSGEKVAVTGLTEFDIIGSAVNDALERLHEREAALENELRERVRAEKELRERDAHIQRLLSCTEEGIYGIDPDGNCTFCNLSCLKLLGYEHESQLLGVNMHNLIHHSYPDGTAYSNHECRVYLAFRGETNVHVDSEVFWRADGSSFPVEYWSHTVYEDNRVSGAVVTFIDISQRKLLEDQLIQAQKMESIGRLAGGIAHDFNNLLTPIKGYAEFLLQDLAEDNAAATKVERVLKAANRAQTLVQQLLSFSRKQILEMKVIDLNQTIKSFHDIMRRTIRENITIRLFLSDQGYGIRADKNQIEQVLMNLVVNAQDAIGERGEITIETAYVLLDDEYASNHTEVTPGRFLMLAVSDNGCGMDKETRQRIFEPFFTTKGIGKGTGLGLATVYGIVRQHGGNIWVYSEPGKGTTFKVYFPIVDDQLAYEQPALPEEVPLPVDRLNILVVEDNEMVRTMVDELLTRRGYEVLSTEFPQEALQMVNGKPLDLLIADVVMPVMTGPELHAKLLNNYPGLKVLYMSGYTSNVIVHQGVLDEGIHYIQKPFAVTEFAKKVEALLKT